MVSVDGSVVVQVVNFLLLIWILNMVLYKPVREVLAKRKQKVLGLESDVDACGQAVDNKDSAYIVGIKKARLNGQKHKETLLDFAFGEEVKIIGKINEDAQIELKEAKARINVEINAVRQSLESDVNSFAKAISQKILGRSV